MGPLSRDRQITRGRMGSPKSQFPKSGSGDEGQAPFHDSGLRATLRNQLEAEGVGSRSITHTGSTADLERSQNTDTVDCPLGSRPIVGQSTKRMVPTSSANCSLDASCAPSGGSGISGHPLVTKKWSLPSLDRTNTAVGPWMY